MGLSKRLTAVQTHLFTRVRHKVQTVYLEPSQPLSWDGRGEQENLFS